MPDFARLTVKVDSEGFEKVDQGLEKIDGGFTRAEAKATAFGGAVMGVDRIVERVLEAFNKLVEAIGETIRKAEEAELATAKLNATLRSTGQYTPEYSEHLQKLAMDLQRVTTRGHEVIEGVEGQLIAFGATSKEVGTLTEAVLNLSEGMGRDLTGATLVVGRALAGEFGTLSRYGIMVDENATKSEKMAQALAQIEQRFGGQARAVANTYVGAVEQLKNAFSDVQEEIGFFITSSDGIVVVYNEITGLLLDAADSLKDYRSETADTRTGLDEWALALLTGVKTVLEWTASIREGISFLSQLDDWMSGKNAQSMTDWTQAIQLAVAALDQLTGGAITAAIEKVREFVGWLQQTAQWLDETFGITQTLNQAWEDSGIPQAVQKAGEAAEQAGAKYRQMADDVQRAHDRASEKIDIRLEVRATAQDDIGGAISESRARLQQLQQQLRTQQAAGGESAQSSAADVEQYTSAVSQAADATDRLQEAVTLEKYRLDLLEQAQSRTTGSTRVRGAADADAAKAAEKAAEAQKKLEEQLIHQADQLARTLDPAYDYFRTMQELEKLKPYLPQELYNKALQQAKEAYQDAATGAANYRKEAERIIEATKTPYQALIEQLEKIKDLSTRTDPKTNATFLDPEQTKAAVDKSLEEYRQLEEGADKTLGNIESAVEDVGKATADAFVKAASSTKFEFTDLLRGIRDDMVRLFAEELFINPIVNSVKQAIRQAKVAAKTEGGVDQALQQTGLQPGAPTSGGGGGGGGTPATPTSTTQDLVAPWTRAAQVVEQGWTGMVGTVQGLFSQMIGGVGSMFTSIFIGLFGGGGGAPSWEGFFKTIGFAALNGVVSGLGSAIGSINWGGSTGSTGIPASEAGGGFSGTDQSTQIGSWSWGEYQRKLHDDATQQQPALAPSTYAVSADRVVANAQQPAASVMPVEEDLGSGRGVRVQLQPSAALQQHDVVEPTAPAPPRRRVATDDGAGNDQQQQVVHMHFPTNIVLQDLDPRTAHKTILDYMPVIEKDFIRRAQRGGELAATLRLRKGTRG